MKARLDPFLDPYDPLYPTNDADVERLRAEAEETRVLAERLRADEALRELEADRAAKAKLSAKLKELGIDPDAARSFPSLSNTQIVAGLFVASFQV